eukprot:g5559.t1
MSQVLDWIKKKLSDELGFDETDEIANYLLNIEQEEELFEFVLGYFGDEAAAREFTDEMLSRRSNKKNTADNIVASSSSSSSCNVVEDPYENFFERQEEQKRKKSEKSLEEKDAEIARRLQQQFEEEEEERVSLARGKLSRAAPVIKVKKKKDVSKPRIETDAEMAQRLQNEFENEEKQQQQQQLNNPNSQMLKIKKNTIEKKKPTDLRWKVIRTTASYESRDPNRHCYYTHGDCPGKVVGNCLHCGKIICEFEGWGKCGFCGAPLDANELQRQSRTGKGSGMYSTRAERQNAKADRIAASLEAAEKRRQRLLEFDRTSAARKTVYDDQEDYYDLSKSHWLSDADKSEAARRASRRRDKMHNRRRKKTTIDLETREIVEVTESETDEEPMQLGSDRAVRKMQFTNNNDELKEVYALLQSQKKEGETKKNLPEKEEEEEKKKQRCRLQHEMEDGPSETWAFAENKETQKKAKSEEMKFDFEFSQVKLKADK